MPKDTSMQMVELLYRAKPVCDYAAIKRRVQQLLGNIETSDETDAEKAFLIFHRSYVASVGDMQIPAQTALLLTDRPAEPASYADELQQSWHCPDAAQLLEGLQGTLLVTEMMSRTIEPHDRAMLFHGVLQAVVEITGPEALVFLHSQQVVKATDYLSDCSAAPIFRRGALNVRFFTITDTDDMIMDTRGLHELGLHELQCHFHGLDPNAVSGKLYDTAAYIFEKGAVIKPGETIEGLKPTEKWLCQFENSILEPKRETLDLNPGKRHAAGNR